MSIVNKIYDHTVMLYSFLVKAESEQEDRDNFIEKVQKLIDDRQVLLKQMKPPFSEEEVRIGIEIADYDKKINILLKKTLNEIKGDILSLKQKKQQHNRYENPYSAAYEDGTFLDKKK